MQHQAMEQPTLEKLICHESFINYCLQVGLEDIEYWEQWVEANPQHRQLVEDAKGLVELMHSGPSRAEIVEERVRPYIVYEITGGLAIPLRVSYAYR